MFREAFSDEVILDLRSQGHMDAGQEKIQMCIPGRANSKYGAPGADQT